MAMFVWLLFLCILSVVVAFQHDPAQPMGKPSTLPTRPLQPPFPNGACGGRVVTISSRDIFKNYNALVLPPRDIQVWLPPTYDNVHRFPVLYCHDGQNAMEDSDSWTGASWRLTGCLSRLANRNLIQQIPIVVMLPSAEEDLLPGIRRRHLEYGDIGQIFAEAHADLVAHTIKPLIDSSFCTYTSEKDTFAIGTSLGGQASLHLLLRHPTLFGGAACLSPAFQPRTLAAAATQKLSQKRLYLDIGGDMGDQKVPFLHLHDHLTSRHWWNPGYFWLDTQLQPSVDAMSLALHLAGVGHAYHKIPGARHNERAWAQRIHLPLLHLYGNQ